MNISELSHSPNVNLLLNSASIVDIYTFPSQDMNASFPYIRKTRGDGNCFFRAFGFAYMEKLLSDKAELHRFVQ